MESVYKIINTPYFWGFVTYIAGQAITLHKNKNSAKKTDEKLSEIDKRQTAAIAELQDDKKHEKFSKSLSVKLTTESYSYISDFNDLDKQVNQFLLQGANNAIGIFEKILYSGFENYSKEVVSSQFEIASNNISSKFSSEEFPINKNDLFSVIDKERRLFIFELDTLMNSDKVNGVRRGEFERICSKMIMSIITEVSALNGAKLAK